MPEKLPSFGSCGEPMERCLRCEGMPLSVIERDNFCDECWAELGGPPDANPAA